MSRYIDAEKIKFEPIDIIVRGITRRTIERMATETEINAMPTADVEEVRHGKWDVWGDRHCCSECSQWALFDEYEHIEILSYFCPKCGAKMDKEKEE